MFRHGNFISKIKNTGGFSLFLYELYVGTVRFWVDCVTFKYGPLEMIGHILETEPHIWSNGRWYHSNKSFISVRGIFSFPLLVYCNQERGEENCSLGTFCSRKCGTWKGKCQLFFVVVPRTAYCCVISYLNSGLNNTMGGHGAFHNPFTSFCAKMLLSTL